MFSDKAPYLVTLIVAGLAWTITHLADRLLAAPLLTYHSQILASAGKKSFYLTFKNITRDKTFRNVRLILTAARGDVLTEAAVIPVQPAWEGDQPGTTAGRTFEYTFSEMQPGSQFEVSVVFGGPDRPTLRMSTDGTINIMTPSWQTYVVENEVWMLVWLFAIGLLLLFVASVISSRSPKGVQYDT
jgi:hypothetical protein